MKQLVITQYGSGEIEDARVCVLEVADNFDESDIDDSILDRLMDESGVVAETVEFFGYHYLHHDVEGVASKEEVKSLPVIRYSADTEHSTA